MERERGHMLTISPRKLAPPAPIGREAILSAMRYWATRAEELQDTRPVLAAQIRIYLADCR